MANIDVEKYRKILVSERDRIHGEMEVIETDISDEDSGSGQSDLSDYDQHPADAGSDTFYMERDLAVRDNYHDILGRIDEALGKIERGTYGTCDRCGREITKARLEAIPYALYCVECQDIIEGR